MAIIVVTSVESGEGKTGVAAAIARHFAYEGQPVRLVRTGSGDSAGRDAAYFGSLDFVPGTHSVPVDAATVSDDADSLLVVEADQEDAGKLGGIRVEVQRGSENQTVATKTPALAVVRTAVRSASPVGAAASPLVVELPEDRTLAGFSFDEVREILHAQTLVEGDEPQTCDYLVIAPIASDAGQPYFRRFDTKAVVVRFDRTDMHLAAMQADPEFLVLTGGRHPSGYLFDAAQAKGVPVLLSANDTENTVMALEGIFEHTRFQGERKLLRISEMLEASPLFDALSEHLR